MRFSDGIDYGGTITELVDEHHARVLYDDGQSETVRFPDPDVRVTGFGPEAPAAKPAAKPRAKPPRAARTAPAAAPAATPPAAKKPQSKPAPRPRRAAPTSADAPAQPAAKKLRTAPEPAPAPRARPPRAARGGPDARVGRWVEVWWPEQSKWYLGHVGEARYSDAAAGVVFRVEYTDGETEDEVLQEDAFAGAGAPPSQPEGAPKAWRFATEPTEPIERKRWTPQEEEDLRKLVEELGEEQWDAVAERLGTGRTGRGAEHHWGLMTGTKTSDSRSTGRKPHAPRFLAARAASGPCSCCRSFLCRS